ncbi:MAG: DUF2344 domain-containing protein, partial [Nitrospirae bacterium]|nr:DUF2344 domain-containing protein [Nitrospirota bacterium]
TDEEYEDTLEKIFSEKWQNIKLYFMIGLPTETERDVRGIIDMTEKALRKGRELTGSRVNINAGISAFVPKPYTPFQWLGQAPFRELRSKQDLLRREFRKRKINFKGQHVESSLLEAVFSRGDGKCATLLENAWRSECRFDGWSECFDFRKWQLAAEKSGIDLCEYAERSFDMSAELPWDFIDIGVTKEFLQEEYKKSLQEEMTPDCRSSCHNCGIACETGTKDEARNTTFEVRSTRYDVRETYKFRVRFSKTAPLHFLSHREVMTAFLRALCRAGIPLVYSRGFHPHPGISFGPPLPVGVEGENEYFDIELSVLSGPSDILSKMNNCLPEGLAALEAVYLADRRQSLDNFISRYEYRIPVDNETAGAINSFMGRPDCIIKREEKMIDIRPMVEKIEIRDGWLNLTLSDITGVRVRLFEVLKELFRRPSEALHALPIKRIALYGYNNKGWIDPMEDKRNEQ